MALPLVVVTGASSGIGKAVAKKFSGEGYPLLLLARRSAELEKLNLPNTIYAKVNVDNIQAMDEAIKKAESKFGPVGCLVNNAGVMSFGQFGKHDIHEWEEIIRTNILGVMNGIQSVINSMREREIGTIINISSIAGHKTFPHAAAYCASKSAVNALSEVIRAELATSNVRLVTISPGGVDTALHTHMHDKQAQADYETVIKDIHLLSPEELANMVFYAYQLPQHICLRQITIAPTNQVV